MYRTIMITTHFHSSIKVTDELSFITRLEQKVDLSKHFNMANYLPVLATLVVLIGSAFGQFNAETTIYENNNQGGAFHRTVEYYRPNLGEFGWNDRAYSTCANGVWLYYVHENYNAGQVAGMEYVFGPNNFCVNFNSIYGQVTSMRFAGDPRDYRADTITIYQEDYFQGEEEYLFVDTPVLDSIGDHKSIIITGASPWTVYDRTNYAGNSICLYPPDSSNYTPALIVDTTDVSIPHGTIQSVRKGCHGKAVHVPMKTQGSARVVPKA